MSKTNFLEESILNSVLLGQAFAPTGALTIGLFTADPGEGTPANEVSGNNYARQSVEFTSNYSGGITKCYNTSDITFPIASGNWGTVTHFVIFKGTDAVYVGSLSPTQTINTNGQLKILATTLEIGEE
jgi:hypothetical protein